MCRTRPSREFAQLEFLFWLALLEIFNSSRLLEGRGNSASELVAGLSNVQHRSSTAHHRFHDTGTIKCRLNIRRLEPIGNTQVHGTVELS